MPRTYAQKIIKSHLTEDIDATVGQEVSLKVDRVAMQDATAQMAILQFMNTGKSSVEVPSTIHCDHLIQASLGAAEDLAKANQENNEVYQFLKSAANKYGMGFWQPGSGIIHQVVLENYAIPGQIMIGTDSHTPNAGGLGMIAIGVGGADAVDAMVLGTWKVKMPKLIGVNLQGSLQGWTSPKDIILKVAKILTVKGGTGSIIEYFGEGVKSISATGRATITNMGAEVGATTSLFPYDERTAEYLRATGRADVVKELDLRKQDLQADAEVIQNPLAFFNDLIELNLDTLEPQVVGPHTPDLGRAISELSAEVDEKNFPPLTSCLIGSCTNSSYEDMQKASSIALQAMNHGMKVKVPLLITPGSDQIYNTIKRDGLIEIFEAVGGKVLANACGPCIGQWAREDQGENSIITSYNRNFKKRNDANPKTHAFIASPEIVTAMAFSGELKFNPVADDVEGLRFEQPIGEDLPKDGFVPGKGFINPSGDGDVVVNPDSKRISLLEPFTSWNDEDFKNLFVLLKAKGKCTTDHISPAGRWLKYRGHLDNISDNMYSGAVNCFNDQLVGMGKNLLTSEIQEFNQVARSYKASKRGWIVIGDENYGEGSSREHAAMEPRFLGCRAVIAKSYARIAETNLKRQGVLALTFSNSIDYDKILEDDLVTIDPDWDSMVLTVEHVDGIIETIPCKHSFSEEEKAWFKAGSALEFLKIKDF